HLLAQSSRGEPCMRLLIVGAGPRGIEHGEAMRELAGWTVAGVFDPRLEARERAANSLGAATFANLEDGLRRTRPDVVTIAAPPLRRTGSTAAASREQGRSRV